MKKLKYDHKNIMTMKVYKLISKGSVIGLFSFLLLGSTVYAQDVSPMPTTEQEADQKYKRNITKSRINGVYIPKDHLEALKELKAMSPQSSLAKFKNQDEKTVARKLHFGLGRWIRYNWNFYDGSRLSHYIKSMGVSHPDDMSEFLIRLLHRDLNAAPLDEKTLIKEISTARKAKRNENIEILETKTRRVPKN